MVSSLCFEEMSFILVGTNIIHFPHRFQTLVPDVADNIDIITKDPVVEVVRYIPFHSRYGY